MIPLRVAAELAGQISTPHHGVMLDALLMFAVAQREGLPPLGIGEAPAQLEIPIALEPAGRFYLVTEAISSWEQHDVRWINRRFPVTEAQAWAEPKFRRINIASGAQRSYRLPLEVGHVERDEVIWFCIGRCLEVRELLGSIQYLGKKRASGLGRVKGWNVEPCRRWGEGFPIIRDGWPTRSLPLDFPGVRAEATQAERVLTPPYWEHHREELCAVP